MNIQAHELVSGDRFIQSFLSTYEDANFDETIKSFFKEWNNFTSLSLYSLIIRSYSFLVYYIELKKSRNLIENGDLIKKLGFEKAINIIDNNQKKLDYSRNIFDNLFNKHSTFVSNIGNADKFAKYKQNPHSDINDFNIIISSEYQDNLNYQKIHPSALSRYIHSSTSWPSNSNENNIIRISFRLLYSVIKSEEYHLLALEKSDFFPERQKIEPELWNQLNAFFDVPNERRRNLGRRSAGLYFVFRYSMAIPEQIIVALMWIEVKPQSNGQPDAVFAHLIEHYEPNITETLESQDQYRNFYFTQKTTEIYNGPMIRSDSKYILTMRSKKASDFYFIVFDHARREYDTISSFTGQMISSYRGMLQTSAIYAERINDRILKNLIDIIEKTIEKREYQEKIIDSGYIYKIINYILTHDLSIIEDLIDLHNTEGDNSYNFLTKIFGIFPKSYISKITISALDQAKRKILYGNVSEKS